MSRIHNIGGIRSQTLFICASRFKRSNQWKRHGHYKVPTLKQKRGPTVGDKIKFPLRLKKSFESRYKAAKQVSGSSDFPHKSRLQLRVKSL